jgi:hypothetical protein
MRNGTSRTVSGWWVAAASGLLLFLCGCDPTIRATTENGIISLSQSFLGAFLQALIQLGAEAQTTS